MVIAGDQAPAWRTAYRSAKDPPCDGSIQLKTAAPSGARDQLGCRLPGPEGFASGVAEKVWLKTGSANKAPSKSERIIACVTPLLGEHESLAIFNLKAFPPLLHVNHVIGQRADLFNRHRHRAAQLVQIDILHRAALRGFLQRCSRRNDI